MPSPWTDGPKELIQHAVDHLSLGGDFDRRIAMISIDNAVELAIKTFLGLPQRVRGTNGPTRRELENASESFPALLDLLQSHAADKIAGLSLDDIEWYHRLRNQLYHSGNGITIERSKVETYLQLAISLFTSLFGTPPSLDFTNATRTKSGYFLELWNRLDQALRKQLPPKQGFALDWKVDYLNTIDESLGPLYISLSRFRNELVHGLESPEQNKLDAQIADLKRMMSKLGISTLS